jgi:hypothetical protein
MESNIEVKVYKKGGKSIVCYLVAIKHTRNEKEEAKILNKTF